MDDPPEITVARARALRRRLTLPEVLVWTALRSRRLDGLRFRRQHPIGPWILDFYCEARQLAVEIDGQAHDHPDALRRDARRTAWLADRRIAVLRLSARDVLDDLPAALERIRHAAAARATE
jgi:very-short-patch-repair endonuclease